MRGRRRWESVMATRSRSDVRAGRALRRVAVCRAACGLTRPRPAADRAGGGRRAGTATVGTTVAPSGVKGSCHADERRADRVPHRRRGGGAAAGVDHDRVPADQVGRPRRGADRQVVPVASRGRRPVPLPPLHRRPGEPAAVRGHAALRHDLLPLRLRHRRRVRRRREIGHPPDRPRRRRGRRHPRGGAPTTCGPGACAWRAPPSTSAPAWCWRSSTRASARDAAGGGGRGGRRRLRTGRPGQRAAGAGRGLRGWCDPGGRADEPRAATARPGPDLRRSGRLRPRGRPPLPRRPPRGVRPPHRSRRVCGPGSCR